MTVAITTNRIEYTASGSQSIYDYTFKIFAQDELEVVQVTNATPPVESVLTLTTDYTVSGVGETAGGSITLVAGNLTAGYKLIIRRKMDLLQETSIRNQNEFFPENHENQFDRDVMIAQQQQDDIDRSVKLPTSVVAGDFDPTLPTGIEGAVSKAIITSSSGDGFAPVSEWPSATDISDAFSNATAAAASAAAAAISASTASAAADSVMFQDVVFVDNSDSPITLLEADRAKLYVVDSSAGDVTINLPTISGLDLTNPFSYGFRRTDATSNTVTVNAGGSDEFNDASTSITVSTGGGVILVPDTDPTPDTWTQVAFGAAGGAAGDNSWTMTDLGSGQVLFNSGSRNVNGIIEDIASDITSNATVVSATDDTLVDLSAAAGLLYAASASTRVFVFYDIVNDVFKQITNTGESSDYTWDYRNASPSFTLNLSQYVPVGYIDVTASGSPGSISVVITNFPVQAWTSFNNTAAAESWQDWSPVLTNGTNISASRSRYRRVANGTEFILRLTASGSGSGGALEISLPVPATAAAITNIDACGSGIFADAGVGDKGVHAQINANGTMYINEPDSEDGNLDGADFGAGDNVYVSGFYEIDADDGYNPISVGFPSLSDLVSEQVLSGDVTVTGVIADFSKTDLDPSKTYKVSVTIRARGSGNSVQIYNGTVASGTALQPVVFADTAGTDDATAAGFVYLTPSTGTVQVNAVSANRIIADDSKIAFEEIPQSGVGVLVEQAGSSRGGILAYYNKEVVDLASSGNFTSGSILVERVNQQVTITAVTNIVFPSDDQPTSASGLIPTWARPTLDAQNACYFSSAALWRMSSNANGSFEFLIRDYAGSASNDTGTNSEGMTMSYSVGSS